MKMTGYTIPAEGRRNIGAAKVGSKNPNWLGDNVGYAGVHTWVRARKPKPAACEDCGKIKKLDLANISGRYLRNIDDYEYICRRCHMNKDGRLERFKETSCSRPKTG